MQAGHRADAADGQHQARGACGPGLNVAEREIGIGPGPQHVSVVCWDVTGDGKTSVKAFFGIFGDTMGADFSQTYNPNSLVTTRYRWSGPCVVTR